MVKRRSGDKTSRTSSDPASTVAIDSVIDNAIAVDNADNHANTIASTLVDQISTTRTDTYSSTIQRSATDFAGIQERRKLHRKTMAEIDQAERHENTQPQYNANCGPEEAALTWQPQRRQASQQSGKRHSQKRRWTKDTRDSWLLCTWMHMAEPTPRVEINVL